MEPRLLPRLYISHPVSKPRRSPRKRKATNGDEGYMDWISCYGDNSYRDRNQLLFIYIQKNVFVMVVMGTGRTIRRSRDRGAHQSRERERES